MLIGSISIYSTLLIFHVGVISTYLIESITGFPREECEVEPLGAFLFLPIDFL